MNPGKFYPLFFALLALFAVTEAQSCYKITLNKAGLLEPSCNLNGVSKVYLHSGACSSNANDCAINDSIWQHIVGNWVQGVGQDDGLGLMTDKGNGNYEITFDPDVYYGTPGNINTAEGGIVMPSGATVYSIGVVFRNPDGSVKGADNTVDCGDIFIKGINTGSPTVVDHFGDPFGGVTFSICTGLREEINSIASTEIYPNPARGNVWIDFTLIQDVKNLSVKVFNQLGQQLDGLYQGFSQAGTHSLQWNNAQMTPGIYFLVMDADGQMSTSKIIVAE
ncbi:MAG: T9SS type A sorting domain-containing protein [Bacteroidia bacterium]|nr:T9SS type A sorting domain-containing protein [Bacteroidia bacterium]